MAVLFGRKIRELGAELRVYKLCEACAGRFGFDVAHSPEALLDGADLLVWGGGSSLIPWRGYIYRKFHPKATRGNIAVMLEAERQGVRLVALSVGGDGNPAPPDPRERRAKLLSLASRMTVRNQADLALPQRMGVRCEWFPDIVWHTSAMFPVTQSGSRGRLRIGIDVYPSNLLRQYGAYFAALLQMAVLRRPDVEFVFIDSANRTRSPYRGIGLAVRGRNVTRYQFEHLEPDLRMLAGLDAIVSTRLHVPMVCLTYGVPAASVFGEGKTRLLFDSLGFNEHFYRHSRMAEWAKVMLAHDGWERWIEGYRFPPVDELREASRGHLRVLADEVNAG
jgi:polysaccharide pyruvyl transferase WcaK-like protein